MKLVTGRLLDSSVVEHWSNKSKIPSHPTEIRTTSISPSSVVEINTTSALANYATEAGRSLVFFVVALAVVTAMPQKLDEPIPILKQSSNISPEGAYEYSYETGNGIAADETGVLHKAANPEDGSVVVAEGRYSWTAPDGKLYSVTYKADENGFQCTLIILASALCHALTTAAPQQVTKEPIAIVSYNNEIRPEGGYQWSYETANGIKADEIGTLVKSNDPENGEVIEAEGGYSYTGPEGVPVNIRYIATANGGFVATGDAIPVAPPIPPAIQRALDYLATLPSTTEGRGRR
uniref:Uncharacterized protein n=1 Tax=Timema poppense TaxID=170557 RepID=A0A7R9CLN6_TIMPO|nr:unnamed protein product [Timema poppensis]